MQNRRWNAGGFFVNVMDVYTKGLDKTEAICDII